MLRLPSGLRPRIRASSSPKRERGQVIILFALMIPVLIGFAGIAIDVGLMMVYRTQDQRAADAAALAGGRILLNCGDDGTCLNLAKNGKDLPHVGAYEYAKKNGYDFAPDTCNSSAGGVCVNIPPSNGKYDAMPNPKRYIEVIIKERRNTFFMRVLGIQDHTIGARAVAAVTDVTKPYALMVMHPTVCHAYSHQGSASMTINKGGAVVNSNGKTGGSCVPVSANQGGGGSLVAQNCANKLGDPIPCPLDFFSEGLWVCGSNATCSPTPTPIGNRFPDPLADLHRPTPCKTAVKGADPPGCDVPVSPDSGGTWSNPSSRQISGSSTVTLRPGVYWGGIKITGNPTIIFQPGTYIMAGGGNQGGFDCCSTGSNISGSGVTIINMRNPYTGGECGTFKMTGSNTLNLSAPVQLTAGVVEPVNGDWAQGVRGILFWQGDNCTREFAYGGSGWSATGVFYIPKANFKFTGSGQMGSVQIIVLTYVFAGSANTTITYHNFVDPTLPTVKLIE